MRLPHEVPIVAAAKATKLLGGGRWPTVKEPFELGLSWFGRVVVPPVLFVF